VGHPNIGGSGFITGIPGVNLNVALANPANPAVLNRLIPGANPALPGQGITVYVNPDGSIFTGFDRAGRGGRGDSQIIDGYHYKALNNGQIGVNFNDALTVSPLTRYNAFAQGNYEINDAVEAFFQSNFSNTTTASVQEPAPITGGWSANVNYNSASPQAGIPQELRQVLNSRANPNAPFQITQLLPFNRTSAGEVYSYNMTAGLRGSLPIKDWKYEIFGSQGKTQSTVTQSGFGSLQRYRTIINFGNLGQGFRATGNAEGGGFGASTATCTSGLNPFSGAPVSADCLEAIKADIKTQSVMHQTVWEGDVTGTLFDLPAGPLQTAIGASYRSNNYRFANDMLTTQGRSFLEQSIGLYPAGNSSGKIRRSTRRSARTRHSATAWSTATMAAVSATSSPRSRIAVASTPPASMPSSTGRCRSVGAS
jgi:iron complex outermembrane receptor protein